MRRRLLPLAAALMTSTAAAQDSTVVLRAGRLLDGVGHVRTNVDVTVRGGKIASIAPASGALPPNGIDLSKRTLLPGLIDVHVHMGWYFNDKGRLHTSDDGDSPEQQTLAHAGNAWATLRAGFTTVQSVGERDNKVLRDAILAGRIPGPRILTSLEPLNERTGGGSPDALRAAVRERKAEGADLIKIFASKSIRDGGEVTMTQEQLDAACGEAKALGMRTLVHAHSAESIKRSVRAGCTEIEHGVFVDAEALTLMADRGVWFDPQCGLVFHNYLDNRAKYEGIGNYNEAGFAAMEKAIPLAEQDIRQALAVPGLKIVFGTDAVAGAHGRNAEELICRVRRAGQDPSDAIASATSRAAESLGLGQSLGRIAVGYAADLVATDGDPSREIEALRRVRFVMRDGHVYRNE